MALGSQIRHYREGLRLTLEQLAERTGVDVGTISALEIRNSGRSKYTSQIARGFDLTVEQLLDTSVDYLKSRVAPSEVRRINEPLLTAREPAAAGYGHTAEWPFSLISPIDYAQLDEVQRAKVEGFIQGLLMSGKQRRTGRR